ncbi:MAG TPA: hypothetical protein VMC80_01515 [Patescibacteria group bacterium]|nr:hypothetical protein [Patescibacteria group bacterium]
MKEDIGKLIVQWSSIPTAIILCGSVAPTTLVPIEKTIERMYKRINPKVKASIEGLVSKGYENLRIVSREMRKLIYYNDNLLSYHS